MDQLNKLDMKKPLCFILPLLIMVSFLFSMLAVTTTGFHASEHKLDSERGSDWQHICNATFWNVFSQPFTFWHFKRKISSSKPVASYFAHIRVLEWLTCLNKISFFQNARISKLIVRCRHAFSDLLLTWEPERSLRTSTLLSQARKKYSGYYSSNREKSWASDKTDIGNSFETWVQKCH